MHNEFDYKVCEGSNPGELERTVHHMMHTHGWAPLGGLSVVRTHGVGSMYYQAMLSPNVKAADNGR